MIRVLPTRYLLTGALVATLPFPLWAQNPVSAEQVVGHYVAMAGHRYQDATDAAHALNLAIGTLLRDPSESTFAAAKAAWLEAHKTYSHTEVFRFGNPNVDAWEGGVNAWPMDEGLIDYVGAGYVFHAGNPHAQENLIASRRITIDDEAIEELMSGQDPKAGPLTQISDIETNVTKGFHAIEFLLWGQDQEREGKGCGTRPYTDYVLGEGCTNGSCNKRRVYLSSIGRTLVRDLREMVNDWDPKRNLYATRFQTLPIEEQLDRMILGMGSLSFAELASERIQVALLTGDQEEEQSCFSDTTHHAIYHNARCIETLYHGTHRSMDGSVFEGPSLAQLLAGVDPELDRKLRDAFAKTETLTRSLVAVAEAGEPFDQMIRPDNAAGQQRLENLILRLQTQTELLETVRSKIDQLVRL